MKNKNKIITILIMSLLILFLIITYLIITGKTISFDEKIYTLLPHNDFLTSFMKFITIFGSTAGLSLIAITLFILIKDKKKSILFPLNLTIIGSLNYILKFIIRRERPLNKLVSATGFSFPSGHSASSLAFYGFLIYYTYKKCQNTKLKIILISIQSLLIILIGISRVYLHVHFATDVIGGFLYSLSYLILYIKLTKNIFKSNS